MNGASISIRIHAAQESHHIDKIGPRITTGSLRTLSPVRASYKVLAFGRGRALDYGRLRAEYDAAFDRLRVAHWELQSIRQQLSPDKMAEEAARQRADQAMGVYRACRTRLADFLISRQPVGRPAVWVSAQPLGVWTVGIDRRAAGSKDSAPGRRDEVQDLAHRLWEDAGRPMGSADAHWYRAEEILRSGR